MSYESVIGIETHVELATASKMFCGCKVDFGAEPNTTVCPVCLGLPGAMPVPNERAIEWIVKIGLALGCDIAPHSLFHRKNYFYPDLPKNYQISQYDLPICVNGTLDVTVDGETRAIGITRVHMEEDTGKSLHVGEGGRIHGADHSLLDFNRSGVPLVEVVSEPDIRSAAEARAYATELQGLIRSLGVSDAKLEEGSMRFDANVSLRPEGVEELGIRTETKNMNSLRSLEQALAYEIDRQGEVLGSGGSITQETRHWNEQDGMTHAMRGKEESSDYRYFPEPDLVPLAVDDAWREQVRSTLPELPQARRIRLMESGIEEGAARQLAADAAMGELFTDAVAAGGEARDVANWLTGEVVAHLKRDDIAVTEIPLTSDHLRELSEMTAKGDLSATAAKEVLGGVMMGEGSPSQVAAARDLIQVTDVAALGSEVDAVLAANGDAVEKIRQGETKAVGFLVGQVMKATGGKADPKVVGDLIVSKVKGG
ncbi:MAG: Asp-tRNA(Asn)/Glu-tRNA(Gln) amidotransferase subunit GatB [Acidimicrobiia bacterium]|nr:Asp-tRNA(Asn)/Glu-tRNA(Gln) amidotransferase subunit GatB [Acidimicrobiia bacterium]